MIVYAAFQDAFARTKSKMEITSEKKNANETQRKKKCRRNICNEKMLDWIYEPILRTVRNRKTKQRANRTISLTHTHTKQTEKKRKIELRRDTEN